MSCSSAASAGRVNFNAAPPLCVQRLGLGALSTSALLSHTHTQNELSCAAPIGRKTSSTLQNANAPLQTKTTKSNLNYHQKEIT
jgi:hypothetical protein